MAFSFWHFNNTLYKLHFISNYLLIYDYLIFYLISISVSDNGIFESIILVSYNYKSLYMLWKNLVYNQSVWLNFFPKIWNLKKNFFLDFYPFFYLIINKKNRKIIHLLLKKRQFWCALWIHKFISVLGGSSVWDIQVIKKVIHQDLSLSTEQRKEIKMTEWIGNSSIKNKGIIKPVCVIKC